MTIPPLSKSYPLLGAADAAGVDYGLAARFDSAGSLAEQSRIWAEGVERFGHRAMATLEERLKVARIEGRLI